MERKKFNFEKKKSQIQNERPREEENINKRLSFVVALSRLPHGSRECHYGTQPNFSFFLYFSPQLVTEPNLCPDFSWILPLFLQFLMGFFGFYKFLHVTFKLKHFSAFTLWFVVSKPLLLFFGNMFLLGVIGIDFWVA